MNGNKAKLKFHPNNFEIVEKGDYVICAISGKKIPLNELTYWNVELQEAYYSPREVKKKIDQIKKKINLLPSRMGPNPLTRIF